ncbi:arylacetonitrilase [Elsinoe australis]|uniref:nitrilase n=1 Tax=Elsinoe australis TaxID=40998 RepID=A0A4V6DT01_9PEZI|nr:arylacetonitrilase [Elsinoe australis]
MIAPPTVRAAVTQHEPVWLNIEETTVKTVDIIGEAARAGCKLVVFPELWTPGYPAWIWTRSVDFELGVKYVQNSLRIESSEMKSICNAAAEHQISVCLGFSERDGESVYISQVLIDETGEIRMKRRKMKPTHMERTIFGDASGDCLSSVIPISNVGRVGALSCWEHIQPLLKYHTFSQGEQIHCAGWPPLDPFVDQSPGFFSMTTEGCRTQAQMYAIESQTFVLHCTSVISEAGLQAMRTSGSPLMGTPSNGSSAIIAPDGRILSQTDAPSEQLIIADLDMSLITKAKTFADASGHYSRPDLLWLGADPKIKKLVRHE